MRPLDCVRKVGTTLLVLALCGCALLRSAPSQPEEWTFVFFPGHSEAARSRADSLSGLYPVALPCAAPDTVTFVVEAACGALNPEPDDADSRLLIVSNWASTAYRPDILRALMAQPDGRQRFAAQATALAGRDGFDGMLLDLRLLGPRDVNSLVALVTAVSDSARSRSIAPVGIVIPVADTAAYPGRHLGALTDFLAVRLELEPASPGPFTPRDRMSALLGARAAETGAHRVMLLIPADGYAWLAGEGRRRVSFEQAVALARDWRVDLVRDESSSTLRATAPRRGEVWVNDAGLIAEIVRDARRLGIRRFALYGLGGEDPAIWSAIAPRPITR
jgi:spore germination protein YaaH